MPEQRIVITAAEFQRNIGRYQDDARSHPITITRNGRERTVLLAVEEYERLRSLDRVAMRLEDLSEDDLNAIRASFVPEEFAVLNRLLDETE